MKKTKGQKEIVDDILPKLEDDETAKKLERIFKLHGAAKEHDKLVNEVKDTVKGFVLCLSETDKEVGKLRIGDFVIPFSVTKVEAKQVSFPRKAGTKVNVKFAIEEEKEEDE